MNRKPCVVIVAAWGWLVGSGVAWAAGDVEQPAPSAAEISRLMQERPLTGENWPYWRSRYLEWFYDRSGETKEFTEALQRFVGEQAPPPARTLPEDLARDAVALDLFGKSLLNYDAKLDASAKQDRESRAEAAYRRAIELDPKYPGGYAGLAAALMFQVMDSSKTTPPAPDQQKRLAEARERIEHAVRAGPRYRPALLRGMLAMAQDQYTEAERLFRQAMEDYPQSEGAATWFVQAILSQPDRAGGWSAVTKPLVERFPKSGELCLLHGLALLRDGQGVAGMEQLDRARELGSAVEDVLGKETAEKIAREARLLTPAFSEGRRALAARNFAQAERCFRKALAENPQEPFYAGPLCRALLARSDSRHEISQLCQRFPAEGELHAYYAVALAREGDLRKAEAELRLAEKLGTDPTEAIGPQAVREIREAARPEIREAARPEIREAAQPGWLMRFLYFMAAAGGFYLGVILLMALVGVGLSVFTHSRPPGAPAPTAVPGEMPHSTSALQKPYLLALGLSLMLFYASVPFVTVGLLATTAGVLYLIFQLPRIPVKLVLFVIIAGLGLVWAVLKSLFTRTGGMEFGIKKTAADCPRLHAAVAEVALRTDTNPVDEIYINPGASIGVRQEGRGPFGVFGVKRRILTLGLSTMNYLTISELKAILAHEYAHFTNRDTFYTRFVQRVPVCIEQALSGMGQTLGKLNYVNPFFWFFWLYYKAYTLLSAGWSRTREFLADGMSASLYGKKAFVFGLTKVATDGTLFEMTIYQNITSLLDENKAFINMYQAFREFRDAQMSTEDRDKLYRALLNEKSSMFASHPSFRERVEAVDGYPDVLQQETASALQLFEDPEAIERELTDYMTGYVQFTRQLQAAQATG